MTHSIPPGRSSDHSVRDLLASRLPPEETGGDFAHDAERLGAILGDLHLAMAEAWGVVPGDAPRWAAEMEDHLRGLVSAGSLRSEEHTSELQPLKRISYAVFCLQNKNK